MRTTNQDQSTNNRSIRVEFMNSAHMEDCREWCQSQGLGERFDVALSGVVRRFSIYALCGEPVVVKFIPNSRVQPTFAWHAIVSGALQQSGRLDFSQVLRVWTCQTD